MPPMPSRYPDSVTRRRTRLNRMVEQHRAAEQRLRVDLARAMRRAIDRKEVTGKQMAEDEGISRWRLYQFMNNAKPDGANGDGPDG